MEDGKRAWLINDNGKCKGLAQTPEAARAYVIAKLIGPNQRGVKFHWTRTRKLYTQKPRADWAWTGIEISPVSFI